MYEIYVYYPVRVKKIAREKFCVPFIVHTLYMQLVLEDHMLRACRFNSSILLSILYVYETLREHFFDV